MKYYMANTYQTGNIIVRAKNRTDVIEYLNSLDLDDVEVQESIVRETLKREIYNVIFLKKLWKCKKIWRDVYLESKIAGFRHQSKNKYACFTWNIRKIVTDLRNYNIEMEYI